VEHVSKRGVNGSFENSSVKGDEKPCKDGVQVSALVLDVSTAPDYCTDKKDDSQEDYNRKNQKDNFYFPFFWG